MTVLYNEIDPFAAQWLRNLSSAGHIAAGAVDTRSIRDLRPEDVRDATQAHFFAGIGVWSYALKLAGWPDSRPVWTGSCPCQPFSEAGARKGVTDDRHLWPSWFRLIRECRPSVIFGEQVEGAVKHGWLDLVSSDMEAEGYAVGAAVLGAHSVGAPHIRQRLYFVAYALHAGRPEWRPGAGDGSATRSSSAGLLADADEAGLSLQRSHELLDGERQAHRNDAHGRGADGGMGNPGSAGLAQRERNGSVQREAMGAREGQAAERGGNAGFWSDAEWLPCQDGKLRPVEPGSQPLVDGAAFKLGSGKPQEGQGRAGLLKGYGNALNAHTAALFIRCAMTSEVVGQ